MSGASVPPNTDAPAMDGTQNPPVPTARYPTKYRKNTPRSRNGCLTCRARRRKCDEVKPSCTLCAKSGRECSWPNVENDAPQDETPSGDRPSEVPQGSGISTSPQKKLPAMGHAEAMDLAASVISEEQVASLRASLTDGNLANLTETSRPLFDQYLSNTAEILARGPSSDGNPFITYVLPLALGDSLIMDCVLGIGGAHMAALDSKKRDLEVLTRGHYARVLAGLQKVLANEAESYFGNTKQEKEQYVLLILLLLCVFEHTQGDIHGSVYHHIKVSRHYILSLMKAPRKTASMDKLGHIRGFLLEIYSFMALKLSITPRGAMEDNPITLDPFLGSLDFLKEYKSCGFMLGFGHGLFGLVPEIADLVEKRRLEELNNSITSATFEAYKSLVAKLDTWDTFSDVLEGKDSSPRFQQGPAVSIYRTALIVYLHSAFHENLHECAELCDEIDLLIDRVLPLLWGVYSSAWSFRRMMLWPACMLASCCRRPQLTQGFRVGLSSNTRAPGGVRVAAKAMELLWADPDPRAFGPRGLNMVMKKHGLSFSMG